MAKQFGVSDEAIAGLNDPASYPFPPDQKAALRFADAMTTGRGAVTDEVFAELRLHFDEPQIIEMAAVIGLFNYFNRFNNALHVAITLMDPEVLVQRAIQATTTHAGRALLVQIVTLLGTGRRFTRVELHGRTRDRLEILARHGSSSPGDPGPAAGLGDIEAAARDGTTRMVGGVSLIVPARHAGAVVGAIVVRRDRPGAFDEEDRAVVERVAEIIAPHLTAPSP